MDAQNLGSHRLTKRKWLNINQGPLSSAQFIESVLLNLIMEKLLPKSISDRGSRGFKVVGVCG